MPDLQALRDRDKAHAGRAQPAKIGEKVEGRAAPPIEPLHHHHLDASALRSIEYTAKARPDASAARRDLLHLEHDSQATRGRSGSPSTRGPNMPRTTVPESPVCADARPAEI